MEPNRDAENMFVTPVKLDAKGKDSMQMGFGPAKELWTTFKKKKAPVEKPKTVTLMKKNCVKQFDLYRDIDIGIDRKYQLILHENNCDDDYDTDEEQQHESIKYCVNQVRASIVQELMINPRIEREDSIHSSTNTDEGEKTLKKQGAIDN